MKNLFAMAAAGLMLTLSQPALADGPVDSSSNAAAGFLRDVEETRGVILRVPINERGEENTEMVSARIIKEGVSDLRNNEIPVLWDQGTAIDDQKTVSNEVVDASTWGWFNYRFNGWARPYYFHGFRPGAWHFGNRFVFNNVRYFNNWYGGIGYRYYYYW